MGSANAARPLPDCGPGVSRHQALTRLRRSAMSTPTAVGTEFDPTRAQRETTVTSLLVASFPPLPPDLASAIAQLTPLQGYVLVLVYFGHCSQHQVAQHLCVHPSVVARAASSGLQSLARAREDGLNSAADVPHTSAAASARRPRREKANGPRSLRRSRTVVDPEPRSLAPDLSRTANRA